MFYPTIIPMRILTPQVVSSSLNTETICIGEAIKEGNHSIVQEALKGKITLLRISDAETAGTAVEKKVQVNHANAILFCNGFVSSAYFMHFGPSIGIYRFSIQKNLDFKHIANDAVRASDIIIALKTFDLHLVCCTVKTSAEVQFSNDPLSILVIHQTGEESSEPFDVAVR